MKHSKTSNSSHKSSAYDNAIDGCAQTFSSSAPKACSNATRCSKNILGGIFQLLLFLLIFGLFAVEIWDPDFWWHLRTGEYIYENHSIPKIDPFSFTALPDGTKQMHFTLSQSWLADLSFYWVTRTFGLQGIIYLRALIFTLLILLLYKGIKVEGWRIDIGFLLLLPALVILLNYTGERPQLFSFLFAFSLFYLVEGFRRNPAAWYTLVPLPLLMMLWANLHGGYVLGIIIIAIYIFSEITKYRINKFGRTLPLSSLKQLSVVGVLSIICSFINPNSYDAIVILLEHESTLQTASIIEWKSPYHFIKTGLDVQAGLLYFSLLSLIILIFLANIRKLDLTDLLLFLALASISLWAVRFIPFFATISTLFIARYTMYLFESFRSAAWVKDRNAVTQRLFDFFKSTFGTLIFLIPISVLLVFSFPTKKFFQHGVIPNRYPQNAVRFLQENRLPGNMLNHYYWGGYLMYMLYPEYKVFIDGRVLSERVCNDWAKINEASQGDYGGLPEWKALLNAYEINFIVTFSVNEITGKLIPLVPALLHDPDWHLIYMDNISLIFLRNSHENEEIIRKFSIPKEWLWNEVIIETSIKIRYFQNNANLYVTLGDVFSEKKYHADAKKSYLNALKKDPENENIKKKLDDLSIK